MNIVSLESNNIKRLKAVQITPDGNVVVIGGNNGQGKTSVLDSIIYALGGKDTHCAQPVRQGEDKAKVVCTLDNGLTITRTFTKEGGSALSVTNDVGAKFSSPQSMLDALVGKLTFDPLAFSRMEPKKQAEIVRNLVGLDFSEADKQRKADFEERTELNREIKTLRLTRDGITLIDHVPAEEVVVATLLDELAKTRKHNDQASERHQDVKKIEGRLAQAETYIADLKTKLEQAITLQGQLQAQHTSESAELVNWPLIDETPTLAAISGAQETNRMVAENKRFATLTASIEEQEAKAQTLTDEITAIDKYKADSLAAAKFPVDGLSFTEEGVLLNGLPFDQASDAEKIRVSISMGFAMNPDLKVILIRDGSLLDEDSLRSVAEMARAQGGQVWIERVGKGDECSVIIEDGQVEVA